MNILMVTNTYMPFVGGVSRSVKDFATEYRKRGHRVIVIAPDFKNTPKQEEDVVRVPAIREFYNSKFSLPLPVPGIIGQAMKDFQPDIIHSHHPYLIGDTALRLAAKYRAPLVFTFHTLYERYTHYLPAGEAPLLKKFVLALSIGYANLCDVILAPSRSLANILAERGVVSPVEIVPTGINIERFGKGDKEGFRKKYSIPSDAFVVGLVSRLAPEKNIPFLAEAVGSFLESEPKAFFLVVGSGPSATDINRIFSEKGIRERLCQPGTLQGQDLADAYHAMDVFAFASRTETQGLVLTEAMAAGTPVVALDGPGVRDVVQDQVNGRLIANEDAAAYVQALRWMCSNTGFAKESLSEKALQTARLYSIHRCADRALEVYQRLAQTGAVVHSIESSPWAEAARMLKAEWEVIMNMTKAAEMAVYEQ